MRHLAQRLLKAIGDRRLIRPGDRVAIAVSGGSDSVALLRILLELRHDLGIVLSVAHVNHKLRGCESEEDAEFVADLARSHALDLHTAVAPLLQKKKDGVEAAARELRYRFFKELLRGGKVTKVATAHTLDDQAETVLLRMMRGAGLTGLGGIHPSLSLDKSGEIAVVRPLLTFRRDELQAYLQDCSQKWREDSSNREAAFLRNRVRMQVVPVLREVFGTGSVENLADLAEIARQEQSHWQTDHPDIAAPDGALPLARVQGSSLAAKRHLVRNWLEQNAPGTRRSFRLIEDLINLAAGDAGRRIEVAPGLVVQRTKDEMRLEPAASETGLGYEYALPVPGAVEIAEIGSRIEAAVVDPGVDGNQIGLSLDPTLLQCKLTVRNWRAGDRFQPASTKSAKKVKELLSDRHVAGVQKRLWPVVVAEGRGVVWMRGFEAAAKVKPRAGDRVLSIREVQDPGRHG